MTQETVMQEPKPLGKLAGRTAVRENKDIKIGTQTYFIPFDNIRVRPDFNGRLIYPDIEALADSIEATGLNNALVVDITEEGIAWISEGHRRYKALTMLKQQKRLFLIDKPGLKAGALVECLRNPVEMTDEQRIVRMISSNGNQVPFHPVELALQAKRLATTYKRKTKDIAAMMGYSRQSVENLLILANEPPDIQQAVLVGDMAYTACLALYRAFPDNEDRMQEFYLALKEKPITVAYVHQRRKEIEQFKEQQQQPAPGIKSLLEKPDDEVDEDLGLTEADMPFVVETPEALAQFNKPLSPMAQKMKAALKVVQEDLAAEEKSHITSAKSQVRPGEIDKGIIEGNMETVYCTEVVGFFDQIWTKVNRLDATHDALKSEIQLLISLGIQRMIAIKEFTVKAHINA